MSIDDLAEAISSHSSQLFAVPGGGPSLELIDALEQRGTDVVTPHHEASAAVMAATVGRLGSTPGFALSIKGPGLANLLPGLSLAALEDWPVVALCEAYAAADPPSRAHKRTDHRRVVDGIVKSYGMARDQGSIDEAVRVARSEQPGPVVLDLVADDVRWAPGPDDANSAEQSSEALLRLVRRSRRPVVILGSLAARVEAGRQLSRCGVPVLTTASAKGAIAESEPNAAGVFTGVGLEDSPEAQLLPDADLIVGFGLRTREVLGTETAGIPVVTLDALAGRATGFPVEASSDLAAVPAVRELLAARSWGEDQVRAVWQRMDDTLLAGPFLPAVILRHVQAAFGSAARLVVDTGDFCTIAEHVWRAEGPDSFLGAGQSRFMGVGIAAALGAALHDQSRVTFLAVGDGGIGPSFGELSLAVDRRLPLAVIFMRDGSLASIRGRALQQGHTTRPLLRSTQRWADAAAGLGFAVHRAADLAACHAAFEAWDPDGGPLFLECRFDQDSYLTMTRGLR